MEPRQVALELSKGLPSSPKNIERIAKEVSAEAARWAFDQWTLRERAKSKFSKAEEMLFDRDGLEMATHESLSNQVHNRSFPEGARVADLTTGIGGDLIALTRGRDAVGFEIDAVRAEYAHHNLGIHGLTADIRMQDCLAGVWNFECAFADPARRSAGRRTRDPKQYSPPLDQLVHRMRELKFGKVKLSPLLSDEFLDSLSPDRVFVSHLGECKEVLVHLGSARIDLTGKPGVWCHIADSNEWLPGETPLSETVPVPFNHVYEADPAAIRAHCLGGFEMAGLGDSNGYLTSDQPYSGRNLKAFHVLWHGAFHEKDVRQALSGTGFHVDVVKCRGVDVDVVAIRKKLHSTGTKPAVLVLYAVGRSIQAVLAERLP